MIRPILALIAAAALAAPLLTTPAEAQSRDRRSSDGVSVTIRKGPSYLNTRTVARPNTAASLNASAIYQSGMPGERINGFQRWPLPSSFGPGY